MCGIFAYIQEGGFSANDLEIIEKYFACIKHRGPDHTSSVILEKSGFSIFLGFHRLAIIDPSPETNPLLQDDGVYLVCNGEIYNYRYLIDKYNLPVKTGSDCEVILQLYKHHRGLWPEILEELDGVFAFVLYDHNSGEIFASRDRMGVRPMFEAKALDGLKYAFASEGKAIPLDTARPYPPGESKYISLGIAKSRNDWQDCNTQWVKEGAYFNASYVIAQTFIRELLIESVRKRLTADRPVGFLVSGGLDSSLVAAIAHRLLGKKITTFAIGLPESPDLKAAAKVAAMLDSDHHEVLMTTDEITTAIPDVIYYNESYDITTTRASIPMYLLCKYIRENTDIKVIFSGEGADELFGGYLYFHNAPSPAAFQKESARVMRDLYNYDVRRGDRMISAWGLELRVPFLDADLISFVQHLDPAHKMPHNHTIEKAILRRAFDGYLPDTVLYRQKEAFSDGVGYNSVAALKQYAADNQPVEPNRTLSFAAKPKTDEARLYYSLFRKYYADRPGMYISYYWMPMWNDVDDPSATVLGTHKKS